MRLSTDDERRPWRVPRFAIHLVAAVGLIGTAACGRWEIRETPEPKTYRSHQLVRVTTVSSRVVLWDARVTRDSIVGRPDDPAAAGAAGDVRLARSEVRAFEELRFAGRRALIAVGAIAAAGVVLAAIIGGGMD